VRLVTVVELPVPMVIMLLVEVEQVQPVVMAHKVVVEPVE
jgi:hypothetical protein